MTTAPFLFPSLSRLHSARASSFPKPPVGSGAGVAFPARPYGSSLRLRSSVMAATGVGGNGSPMAPEESTGGLISALFAMLLRACDLFLCYDHPSHRCSASVLAYLLFCSLFSVSSRLGEVKRVTKETNVHVKINLDGTGVANSSTGIPFLDHMLDQLASHGLFDVYVKATGDTHIDDHHSNEDIALAIGTALLQALGDRKGINRFGHFTAPLDEAAVEVILDLSGRPHLSCGLSIPTERVGTYDTQLVEHFFQSLVNTSGMTLHIRQLAGNNSHHIIEATFKAFARALRQATEYDLRRQGTIPSSKGVLSRS
ncbi:hypothetical protein CFC21_025402 [Triticum aestivum]|uniref:Imidazoleglycerol-phosphate dehydratase n=3 Tax=Triticinae TaxID=1648030 RepID=A0A3B6CCX9_WHEAT|nr:hypothetical protein CFC21_025402 [Triticum aestivum]